jgi:integrase
MIEFIVRAGARGDEELFGFRKQDGNRVALTARAVRYEMKDIARRNGLPPNYFSAHSLRKGSITHMRSQGATEDDRRDRGNYAAGSQVMNTIYAYATGFGPLASNNLEGGREPSLTDVKRRAVGHCDPRQ